MRFSLDSKLHRVAVLLSTALLVACAGNRPAGDGSAISVDEFRSQYANSSQDVDSVNQQLLSLAADSDNSEGVYRLGPGDEITMNVFGVEELSGNYRIDGQGRISLPLVGAVEVSGYTNYRIDGQGRISLPLVGAVEVSGYTLAEAEDVLEARYAEKYLRNPQITVSVMEFRSQQFTAVGALSQPRVYNTQRKITLIEALAMAGGLGEDAGPNVYLSDRVRNPETGELGTRSLAISLDELTQGKPEVNVVLGEQALINVPPAGSVFVEGAVERPGVYQQRGGTTVLKAIAMAGGLAFEANRNTIFVLRRDPSSGEWQQQQVVMSEIRASPNADIKLSDGDIVVVESGAVRTAWMGFWSGLARIAMLGFRPL